MMNISNNLWTLLLAWLVVHSPQLLAQQGYSSASLHWGRMNAGQKRMAMAQGMDYFTYAMPRPRDVVVEEYFNYHEHRISFPAKGEGVALDMQWGKDDIAPSESMVLQIGLATAELHRGSLADAPPVNVSLVIDKSGSMGSDNRLVNARHAAAEFVQRLRPSDHISIVAFDSHVDVILPSSRVGDRRRALAAIDKIVLGGSTDLNSALIAGYGEVAKAYVPGQSNKVIILTDALTNTGVVDPAQIVSNSAAFNKPYNIDISIIGVGVEFNADLSRQITQNARSSIHFINDAEDIKKVFIDEVESLLCPVAREAKLVIEFDEGLELEQFFGYTPNIEGHRIELDLDNLNKGLTQIFLLRLKATSPNARGAQVTARLDYFDIEKNERSAVDVSTPLTDDKPETDMNALMNEEVKKNYAIALMAQSIRDMASFAEDGAVDEAVTTIHRTLDDVQQILDGQYDKDVKRVRDILITYQTDMDMAINERTKNR